MDGLSSDMSPQSGDPSQILDESRHSPWNRKYRLEKLPCNNGSINSMVKLETNQS